MTKINIRYGLYLLAVIGAVLVIGAEVFSLRAQESGYTPVTDERLRSPDADDWLMYRGTYDSWGYSALDQITTGNVQNLVPVWSLSTGVTSGHQAPPIVNDGIMFVTTPDAQVIAIDARTGDQMWRYQRQMPEGVVRSHRTNRGVGLYDDKVFFTTHDAVVQSIYAMTG